MQSYTQFGSMEELEAAAKELRPDGDYKVYEVEEEYLKELGFPNGCWLLLLD